MQVTQDSILHPPSYRIAFSSCLRDAYQLGVAGGLAIPPGGSADVLALKEVGAPHGEGVGLAARLLHGPQVPGLASDQPIDEIHWAAAETQQKISPSHMLLGRLDEIANLHTQLQARRQVSLPCFALLPDKEAMRGITDGVLALSTSESGAMLSMNATVC